MKCTLEVEANRVREVKEDETVDNLQKHQTVDNLQKYHSSNASFVLFCVSLQSPLSLLRPIHPLTAAAHRSLLRPHLSAIAAVRSPQLCRVILRYQSP